MAQNTPVSVYYKEVGKLYPVTNSVSNAIYRCRISLFSRCTQKLCFECTILGWLKFKNMSKMAAYTSTPTALPPKLSLKWLIKYINRKTGTIFLTSSRSHYSFVHSVGSHLILSISPYSHLLSLALFSSIALMAFWHITYLL